MCAAMFPKQILRQNEQCSVSAPEQFPLAGATPGSPGPFAPRHEPRKGAPPSARQQVDLLIRDADIVTFDGAGSVIIDGAIAIKENVIVWMGKAADARDVFQPKETIVATGQTAMPGLTDAHSHTGQELFRGKLASLGSKGSPDSPTWRRCYLPFESSLTPEDVYWSAIASYTSMVSNGTTCFLEAGGPHPDEMGRAADEIGLRGRIALSTMDAEDEDVPPNYCLRTDQALRANEDLVARWKQHPRVNAWLSLRQILVNSETLRIEMAKLAEALDTRIHTHLSEDVQEIEYTMQAYGLRPPAYLEKIGLLSNRLHCAYSPLLQPAEVDLYARHDVSIAYCPCNFYAAKTRPFTDLVNRDVRVALGTDGSNSRYTPDLFQVSHCGVIGQYSMESASQPLGYDQMLKLAVFNGARVARTETQLGSLEVGKLADIVLVASDSYGSYSSVNPLMILAQHCVGRDVRTVIIDGRVVMKDRNFLTIDVDVMRRRVKEQCTRLLDRLF